MKTFLTAAAGLLSAASAFPTAALNEALAKSPEARARYEDIMSRQTTSQASSAELVYEAVPYFDAKAQYVNITKGSGHEFVAPGPNDLRGPCPGLNAFANHGFLPHSGYATIQQFIDATNSVVGMGADLAAFLAVYGAAIDGSGTAWSIGGKPPGSTNEGNGITNSHNKYESDASPTRPDLYQAGNDYKLVLSQYQQLIDMSPNQIITLDSLTKFRSARFDQQIASNPYFFNGPFTGVLVQPAAYTFIYRFMANHTKENPRGILTADTLGYWFAVNGTSGSYTYNEGHEQIPPNWYKRAIAYPYSIPYFQLDFLNAALLYPKFLDIGGNTGTTNSFTGVNVDDLTGGLLNLGSLSKGNNAACLAYQFAAQTQPDITNAGTDALKSALAKISSSLSCPQLQKIDDSQLNMYPGYTKSKSS